MASENKKEQPEEALAVNDGVLGVAADAIDELILRHQSEATLETLEDHLGRRERLFFLVSHDLRSPLSIAKACADIIVRQADVTPVVRSLGERIIQAIGRADNMIKDLLDANRLQAGLELSLRLKPGNLAEIVQGFAEEFTLLHGERCRFEGDGQEIPGEWDSEAIRRALENLVSNAAKYGDPEKPITIRCIVDGNWAGLSVHNWGTVISSAELINIFRWHGRTEEAEKSAALGWGLGLVVVKGISEAHGGTATAESSEDSGTTFTLRFPIGPKGTSSP